MIRKRYGQGFYTLVSFLLNIQLAALILVAYTMTGGSIG